MKTVFTDKPIRNAIVISDKKTAEWFAQKNATPVTSATKARTLKKLSRFAVVFEK